MTDTTPRVWVGCLGCHNNGHLTGKWFDATDAPQDMAEFSPRVFGANGRFGQAPDGHAEEQHEELWCFDHENFHGLLKGECSPSEAAELAAVIERQAANAAAFAAFVDNRGGLQSNEEWSDLEHEFADCYAGEWESLTDFACTLAEELGAIVWAPRDWPFSCVDWEHAWRELEMGGDYWAERNSDGKYYVFRSN